MHRAARLRLPSTKCSCNVIRHGYERRKKRPRSRISLLPFKDDQGDALRIVIEDEAKQVDPATIKSRDLEQIRPGGLGVHIIREVMDDAMYEKRENVGMRLTLVKHKTPKATSKPESGKCDV